MNMTSQGGIPELRDLTYELSDVDWHDLGLQLGVPQSTLKRIDRENPTESRKLAEALQYWLNNYESPSWEKIIEALERIRGHGKIISTIRTRYNIPQHQSLDDTEAGGAQGAGNGNARPDDQVDASHLPTLLFQLRCQASSWRDIGTYLGFHSGELDNIQQRPLLLNKAPASWLRAMLEEWLEWSPGDERGSTEYATLSSLKKAVDRSGFGKTAAQLKF